MVHCSNSVCYYQRQFLKASACLSARVFPYCCPECVSTNTSLVFYPYLGSPPPTHSPCHIYTSTRLYGIPLIQLVRTDVWHSAILKYLSECDEKTVSFHLVTDRITDGWVGCGDLVLWVECLLRLVVQT